MGNDDWYHEWLPGIIAGVRSAPVVTSVTLLKSRLLTDAGFAHAFPERAATQAELVADLAFGLGLGTIDGSGLSIVQVDQVHGGEAIEAADAAGPTRRQADAVVGRSGSPSVAVGVRVADCAPVLVADPSSGDVAAIHAGWRGVTHGIVRAAIERLAARGPVIAAIGPCIGRCCFEVGRDVADRIVVAAGADVVTALRGDKVYVDLRAAVRAQLVAAGAVGERIEDVPGCTKHETARFYSFRRDGDGAADANGRDRGRMLAAIATRRST